MTWSEEEFRERVARRCTELGRSQRAVLRAAGLAHDYLQTDPAHGRRVDTLAKVATALDWSLAEIMGIELIGQADAILMAKTLYIARKVLRNLNPDIAVEAQFLTSIYNTVLDRHLDGDPLDAAALDDMAKFITKWGAAQVKTPQIAELVSTGPEQNSKESI